MYYQDSCVCIDFMRGKTPKLYELFQQCDPARFAIPAIVLAELETGMSKSKHPQQMQRVLHGFLKPFAIVPFDEACASELGRLRARLEGSGTVIGAYDMLIAAMARANNATLVTNNVREFLRVPELELETWQVVSLSELTA